MHLKQRRVLQWWEGQRWDWRWDLCPLERRQLCCGHRKRQAHDRQSPSGTSRWTGRRTSATCGEQQQQQWLWCSDVSLRVLTTAASRSQPSLEPEQPQSSPQAYFWFEDLSDGHASIDELLTPLITDTGHKGSRFTDEAQLLRHTKRKVCFSPSVIPLSVKANFCLRLYSQNSWSTLLSQTYSLLPKSNPSGLWEEALLQLAE